MIDKHLPARLTLQYLDAPPFVVDFLNYHIGLPDCCV
jgi:hypothetical protein